MRKRLVYAIRCGIRTFGALFLLLLPVSAQELARVDVSPFGVIGLAPGETLVLKTTGASPGEGCKAQLGFADPAGRSMARSLNVNLGPGQSAFTSYLATSQSQGRIAIRPVAWVDRSTGSNGKCIFAASVKSKISTEVPREISSDSICEGANCKGVPVSELNRLTLRLYTAATDRICRAQMGFRQSNGRTSVTAKYVTLIPNHAAWLDWHPGDDDLASTDSVIPVVAFHPGDLCMASAEVFTGESEPASAVVSVQTYGSSVIGLAVDPASVEKTIQVLKNELQTNPEDLWAVNALAQAYNSHGERELASRLLSSHLEINPRASESWLLLARFQYEQGDYLSAVVSLEKCLAIDPNNMTAKAAYADSLTKLGRLDEARELFTTLLKDDKTRTPALLAAYAEFLYTEGRVTEALALVQESDVRHPNCGRTLWVEAQILRALDRLPEATRSAERAVQINSNFRPTRMLLMKLYSAQGKKREAAEQATWLRDNAKNIYK